VILPESASFEAESLILLVLETFGAGVELVMSLLKAIVLAVQGDATYCGHSVAAEITFSATGLLRHLLAHRVHRSSPTRLCRWSLDHGRRA